MSAVQNVFWEEFPDTEWWPYAGVCIVGFFVALCIGITGVGGVGYVPGIMFLLPLMSQTVAFGTI